MTAPLRVLSWNIARRKAPWNVIAEDEQLDVALLQEAAPPAAWPDHLVRTVPSRQESWRLPGYERDMCAAVAWFGDRVEVSPLATAPMGHAEKDQLEVSHPGTLAAVEVAYDQESILLVSLYSVWRGALSGRMIYADATVHRLLSDLSALRTGRDSDKPMIVAGDLNIFRGYGDDGKDYWKRRYDGVFQRFADLGIPFVGPRRPDGRPSGCAPEWVPKDTDTVPTYHTSSRSPATAEHQLDFVFATEDLHPRLSVRALNEPEQWGPSDHCRILIELAPRST